MLLTNSTDSSVQYFIRLPNGQELGPYGSFQQASISAGTLPLKEGESPPQIFPKTIGGQQVLFG